VKYLQLFTSLNDRIGRADFWKGSIGIFVGYLVLGGLAIALGFSTEQNFTQTIAVEGEEAQQIVGTQWQVNPWATFLITLIMMVPFTFLAVKRRHDRNFSGVDIYGFVALQLLIGLLAAVGFNGAPLVALSVVSLVWSICLLILLGFLRGTVGGNDFGPDPLTAFNDKPS
jgi:uncharacterized membrane protein YhaH (DUF805 family)